MKSFALMSGLMAVTFALIFTSCSKEIYPPVVITKEVTDINAQTAMCGGEVLEDGGSEILHKGVCWSTHRSPNIENDNKTDEGPGSGSFDSKLTGLQVNTYYFVRAYATNEKYTSYGQEIKFKAVRNSEIPLVEFNGHYLYVYPRDVLQVPVAWGTYGRKIGATDDNDGQKNCTQIIQTLSQFEAAAAKYCDELDDYGYDDWYLPAINELKELYKHKAEIGNIKDGGYWSSTEYTPYEAKYVHFGNGKISHTNKNYEYYLRCVRRD